MNNETHHSENKDQNLNQEPPPTHEVISVDPDMSRSMKFLLFLIIMAVMSGLTWVIVKYVYLNDAAISKIEDPAYNLTDHSEIEKSNSVLDKENKLAKLQEADNQRLLEEQEKQRKLRITQNLKDCRNSIDQKQWDLAHSYLNQLDADQFDSTKISEIKSEIEQNKAAEATRIIQVNQLLDKAKSLDTGNYSAIAVSHVDQALEIYPNHTESVSLRKKLTSYNSTFRIPEDFPSIEGALKKVRAGDTLLIAKGIYKSPLTFTTPITIKGAGRGKTIFQCDTTKNTALTFHGGEKPYSLSHISVQGTTYQDFNISRHPLILVEADVIINDILVEMSSGHGIAVISGSLLLQNSVITDNAWDGISIKGEGTTAHIKKCSIHRNYDHGIDFWQNASGSVTECKVYQNTGTGVVVMGEHAKAHLIQVQSYENHQCGVAALAKASVTLERTIASNNALSGIAIQGNDTAAKFVMAISNNNKEAGFYLDPNSSFEGVESTTSEGNSRGNTIRKAVEYNIKRKDKSPQ